ncbi:MAG: bifunctional phosphopantothenoylcysteine decarboxylase/phosphopantothenate--cysteine ligase CoaBC [Synergistaceae bacterium]|jgi:phosphopantothenoylcysteine decarboxylase/phosphopantothenate--cysteine ligase|nr:bifunctional phosphopantothenoylcysteine decarboxylase/phosphopantothenate--cysteine ligase CoaBC [Synergistaceae bacterium]
MNGKTLAWKRSRKIFLCITGGIAAYKIPDLVSRLKKLDCEVEIAMTEAAETLVSPLALSTLSGRRVWLQRDFLSSSRGFEIPHIRLADWAEVVVIAPCSANTAFGIAQGRAGSVVEAALLATRAPVLLFPAMNVHMFENPATQQNLRTLAERGARVVDPDFGLLACGYEGKGRLPDTDLILEEIAYALSPHRDLAGKHVLVTAGPTREYLDPVRFISNPSSGKMGLAVARTAWYRGAEVRVILGPVNATGCVHGLKIRNVISALEMRDAVMDSLAWADCVVKAAAVGDYRAQDKSEHKIKRDPGGDTLSLSLTQNPDIAAEVGSQKRPGQFLIGFAAETENLVNNARAKLERKKMDLMVANDVTAPGSGFEVDTNKVRLFSRNGEAAISGSKEEVADTLWEYIADHGLWT